MIDFTVGLFGTIEMTSTTGTAIRDGIKHKLKSIGLSLDNLIGQVYDGETNKAGKNNGIQATSILHALL